METKVTQILKEKGIQFTLKKHNAPVYTCEDAARERKCKIFQIVKTMVGKDSDGRYHVCLIPGDKTLKIKKVRKEAGGIKIDLVSPQELEKHLGLTVGAISPLLFPEGTKFYIDPTILNNEFINISSGDPNAGIELKSKDLVDLVEGKICDIISSTP